MRLDRHRQTAPIVGLALATALVTGCSDEQLNGDSAAEAPTAAPTASPTGSPTPTKTPSPTASPDETEWATCESTRAGLQVSYPAGWTARDYPDGGCAYFDPEPFEVQRGTEAPLVAVRLDVESVAFDRVLGAYTDGEDSSQEQAEVAGYPAVRVEDRDTDSPFGAKGERLTYLADLGEQQTLVLTTNEADTEDFDRAKDLLDEMAERLERTG